MEETRVKWWTLSIDEIIVLVWGVLLLPYYAFVLKRSDLPELLLSNSAGPAFKESRLSSARIRRLGVIINKITTALAGDGTCLLRSLVLRRVLSRRDISCVIRLGVLPQQVGFSAHAWVEVDGLPVNDTQDVAQRYLPFDDLNASSEFKLS